jgi:hypothetical protein
MRQTASPAPNLRDDDMYSDASSNLSFKVAIIKLSESLYVQGIFGHRNCTAEVQPDMPHV